MVIVVTTWQERARRLVEPKHKVVQVATRVATDRLT
jgi:hypothetical protein